LYEESPKSSWVTSVSCSAELKLEHNKNCQHMGLLYLADFDHWNFEVVKKASGEAYKKTPDLMRECGSIPVTIIFERASG
jgi:hypothetical protein